MRRGFSLIEYFPPCWVLPQLAFPALRPRYLLRVAPMCTEPELYAFSGELLDVDAINKPTAEGHATVHCWVTNKIVAYPGFGWYHYLTREGFHLEGDSSSASFVVETPSKNKDNIRSLLTPSITASTSGLIGNLPTVKPRLCLFRLDKLSPCVGSQMSATEVTVYGYISSLMTTLQLYCRKYVNMSANIHACSRPRLLACKPTVQNSPGRTR